MSQWNRFKKNGSLPAGAFLFAAGLLVMVWATTWNIVRNDPKAPQTQPADKAGG